MVIYQVLLGIHSFDLLSAEMRKYLISIKLKILFLLYVHLLVNLPHLLELPFQHQFYQLAESEMLFDYLYSCTLYLTLIFWSSNAPCTAVNRSGS